jgi:hypothetical protein
MRIFFYLLLLTGMFNSTVSDAAQSNSALKFNVHQQDYTFSTIFEFRSDNEFLGTAVKSVFRIRTNYDLYTKQGKYEAVGICRMLTLGALYAWGTEIDLYDNKDHYIGMIDGQAMTGAGAKFSIYNANNNCIGIAYLELGGKSFSIVDPNNESHYLVSLTRHFVQDAVDDWSVVVYDQEAIDMRIVKVFAAFATDTQEHFKEDL